MQGKHVQKKKVIIFNLNSKKVKKFNSKLTL